MSKILFFSEDIDYNLKYRNRINRWLKEVVKRENKSLGYINYIFCSDTYLGLLNKTYLGKDNLTDIIAFDFTDAELTSGDVYISIERVVDNAQKYHVTEDKELKRVMVHGLLHLMGYNDKSKEEKTEIRKKENEYLQLYDGLNYKMFHVKHIY